MGFFEEKIINIVYKCRDVYSLYVFVYGILKENVYLLEVFIDLLIVFKLEWD